MAIQDEMYKDIVREIDAEFFRNDVIRLDVQKVKSVAKMLTDLSVESAEADSLTKQYIAGIKNICK